MLDIACTRQFALNFQSRGSAEQSWRLLFWEQQRARIPLLFNARFTWRPRVVFLTELLHRLKREIFRLLAVWFLRH